MSPSNEAVLLVLPFPCASLAIETISYHKTTVPTCNYPCHTAMTTLATAIDSCQRRIALCESIPTDHSMHTKVDNVVMGWANRDSVGGEGPGASAN